MFVVFILFKKENLFIGRLYWLDVLSFASGNEM